CCNCILTIFQTCLCRDDIVILVLGLDNSGKSTLISTIRNEVKNEEIQTWGFDTKVWNTRTFRATIYDLGGGKSIRGIWPHYFSEAYGVIFVVDGADENRIWEASVELKNAMKHPRLLRKPFLIVANKLNMNTALRYEELMGVLGPFDTSNQAFIYSDCRLHNGGVIDKELQLGLDWLLASIRFFHNELRERVAFESNKQRDEERQSLAERRLRSKSFKKEKDVASHSQPVILKDLKDSESETHARMQTWLGPDDSVPTLCTYEQRIDQGKNLKITREDFDKSLQPLIKQYEESSDEPTYSPREITEYFGDCVDKTTSSDEVLPHLPGQPNPNTN
ncbi:hypothetical protein KC19_6G068200, partial [Ceratodon purpureus]